jgi:hypothetical protein
MHITLEVRKYTAHCTQQAVISFILVSMGDMVTEIGTGNRPNLRKHAIEAAKEYLSNGVNAHKTAERWFLLLPSPYQVHQTLRIPPKTACVAYGSRNRCLCLDPKRANNMSFWPNSWSMKINTVVSSESKSKAISSDFALPLPWGMIYYRIKLYSEFWYTGRFNAK